MNIRSPTAEQELIINSNSSAIILAKPGSGKTFTISQKIKKIIKTRNRKKDIIAISYTNKASDELKTRSLTGGLLKGKNYFGTIDKFTINEIVGPFFFHFFNIKRRSYKVVSVKEFSESSDVRRTIEEAIARGTLDNSALEIIKYLYISEGQLVLQTAPMLGVLFFKECGSCNRYIKAKYSHVFIDEYQDSGKPQHELFLAFHTEGIISIAVGDLDQSIFKFAGKSSIHLVELSRREDFLHFTLSENLRCHPSISAYASKFLDLKNKVIPSEEIRVYTKIVDGDEEEIGKWISKNIPGMKNKFSIQNNNSIAILCRGNNTIDLVSQSMTVPFRKFQDTLLDTESSQFHICLRKLIISLCSTELRLIQILSEYLNLEVYSSRVKASSIKNIYSSLKLKFTNPASTTLNTEDYISFDRIISDLLGQPSTEEQKLELQKYLSDEIFSSYIAPKPDEVTIMSLHKSKGLEFEIVIHLDLYDFIMPSYKALIERDTAELEQDKNLHYVGITRAKQACIFLTATTRTNANKKKLEGKLSSFILPSLESMRKKL